MRPGPPACQGRHVVTDHVWFRLGTARNRHHPSVLGREEVPGRVPLSDGHHDSGRVVDLDVVSTHIIDDVPLAPHILADAFPFAAPATDGCFTGSTRSAR